MSTSSSSAGSGDNKDTSDRKTPKPSLYQKYQNWKRGKPIKDEDVKRHLGVSKEELMAWADTQPGVGKNQLAGSISQGSASGLGGLATGSGYGGWGPSAAPNDANRGMKFPPQQQKRDET